MLFTQGQSKLCGQAPLKGLETAMNSLQGLPKQSKHLWSKRKDLAGETWAVYGRE